MKCCIRNALFIKLRLLGNNLQIHKCNLLVHLVNKCQEWFKPLSANVSPNRINAYVSGNSVRRERRVRSFIFVYPQGTPAKYTRATRLCAFRTLSGAAVCVGSLPSNVQQQRRISTHLWSALLAFSSPARCGAIHHRCRHQNRRRRRHPRSLSSYLNATRTARIKNSYT